jgi:hypothetical protein
MNKTILTEPNTTILAHTQNLTWQRDIRITTTRGIITYWDQLSKPSLVVLASVTVADTNHNINHMRQC